MKNFVALHRCLLILLLPVFFISMACSKTKYAPLIPVSPADTTSHDTIPHNDTMKTYTYLALGDSYTIGQSVNEPERFPAQTLQLLASQSLQVSTPLYIATTGWTTSNLLSAIASQNPSKDYDIVTLLIGVNDQYQHIDTATYRTRFNQCLQKAVELSANRPSRVFVISIPDYSVTPFVPASDKARVSREVDEFNSINKEITLQNGISYIDITPSSRLAAIDPTLIAGDGLHPSGKEYAVWAALLAPVIKSKLH